METGIYIRAEVNGKWGSYDIGDPAISDQVVLRWLRESSIEDGKFYPRLVMVLLGRNRESV